MQMEITCIEPVKVGEGAFRLELKAGVHRIDGAFYNRNKAEIMRDYKGVIFIGSKSEAEQEALKKALKESRKPKSAGPANATP